MKRETEIPISDRTQPQDGPFLINARTKITMILLDFVLSTSHGCGDDCASTSVIDTTDGWVQRHGEIYTVDADRSWADAVAIWNRYRTLLAVLAPN